MQSGPCDPSDEVIDKLSLDFESLINRIEKSLVKGQSDIEKLRYQGAGEKLYVMYESIENTVKFTDDPDPNVRRVAISLISTHWKNRKLAYIHERLANTDIDIEVRKGALSGLGYLYEKTKDHRIGAFLAEIICDKLNAEKIRVQAFQSLAIVDGTEKYDYCKYWLVKGIEGIDFLLVNLYRPLAP